MHIWKRASAIGFRLAVHVKSHKENCNLKVCPPKKNTINKFKKNNTTVCRIHCLCNTYEGRNKMIFAFSINSLITFYFCQFRNCNSSIEV